MKNRRGQRVKPPVRRRNPVARSLQDALFRARREANRRRYSRKRKHRQRSETDHA
jgi:stalled ribosome alternative rescue factor ArfA